MPSPRCILALDQGTTSSRAIVFDRESRILAVAQREFPQHFPRPGWVEHDALDIWHSQAAVAVEALARAGIGASQVAAVGIANQRETTVLWERASGLPVGPALVWQDRRTAEHCQRLRQAGLTDRLAALTGLVPDPYFSATKLAWLLDHLPAGRARAATGELCFGTIDTWLAFKLSGGAIHATDASNASRTLLFNLHSGAWDAELLDLFAIPAAVLPTIVDSGAIVGAVSALPELAGVPLAAGIGDQQGALAGQACFSPGLAKNTYGTGCFLLMHTGDRAPLSQHGLLTTVAARRAGRLSYALEGSVFVGGAAVQWLRDGLGLIARSADVEALAGTVPDSGGVVFVPAFTGLGAPHWDAAARGALFGLTRGTGKGHVARATLEAIAFQVADLVDAVEADAGRPLAELRVDGGAAANDLLLQIQADLLQKPVVRPRVIETTALGAAYFAGLACGFWASTEELADHWQMDRRFEPAVGPAAATARRRRWSEAVARCRGWEQP